ncbi:hypothetical protein Fmac_024268 [Flemingia macrophylla]|uniref:Carbohydrate kinase PfkB domain-containing protein n=1 Tax=Flemingia macrophylla TaxID=520843 RepID=A0ABD1LNY3_9FABA
MTGSADALVISFGEMLIDFVPDTSGVSLAESRAFIKAPGAEPAILMVGDDEFGRMLVDILKKNGVNTDSVCFDAEARTALAFVTLRKDGEREFMFYRNPSADMLLRESELNLRLIKQARVFHCGSISLISEPCRSAHLAAMTAARESGALLSYDPNVRLPLWPSHEAARSGIKSIWSEADFIKHDNLKMLLVTDGEKGCRYFTKKFKGRVTGFSVKAVDTTGAGVSFVGALLTAVARDSATFNDEPKLREALTFANACGAMCTTQKGAIPALPTTAEAEKLISNSKGK